MSDRPGGVRSRSTAGRQQHYQRAGRKQARDADSNMSNTQPAAALRQELRPRRLLVVLQMVIWSLVSFTYGLLLCIVGPTTAVLAERTHCIPSDLAPVLGMGGICTLLGGVPSGWLMDRFPGNIMLAIVLSLQAIGLSFNFINTGLSAMVIWTFDDPHQLTFCLNTISAVFGLGGILAPQLVTLGVALGDGSLCYLWTAAAAFACALMLLPLPGPKPVLAAAAAKSPHRSDQDSPLLPPPSTVMDSHHHDAPSPDIQPTSNFQPSCARLDAIDDFAKAAVDDVTEPIQGGADGPPLPHECGHCHNVDNERWESRDVGLIEGQLGGVRSGRPWGVLVPALLTIFANVSIELGYAAWIFTYAREVGGMEYAQAENMTSLFWLLFVLGRAAAAVLATCISPATILLTSMPLALVGAVVPLMHPSRTNTVISAVLVGLGSACGFPSTLSLTAQYVHLDGFMNGVISTVAGLSMTVMPYCVPALAKAFPLLGFHWLMICTLVCGIMQLTFLVWLLHVGRSNAIPCVTSACDDRRCTPSTQEDLEAPLLT